MPARKRHKPGGAQPATEFDLSTRAGRRRAQEAEAQTFAIRRQAERDEERERQRAHREAAQREERRRRLAKDKDAAAAQLKEVRRRGGSAEQRASAEAAYRVALDAVLRDEQGLPPLTEEEARAAAGEAVVESDRSGGSDDGDPADPDQVEASDASAGDQAG